MVIDLVVGLIIVAVGLFGWLRGAVRQVVHLGALAAAVILAPLVGRVLPDVLGMFGLHVPEPVVDLVRLLLAAILLFVGVWLLGTLLVHFLRPKSAVPTLSRLNRLSGGLLGVAKGTVVCLLGLSALAAVPETVARRWPDWVRSGTQRSACVYWVRQWNPLAWAPTVGELGVALDRLRLPFRHVLHPNSDAPSIDPEPEPETDPSPRSAEPEAYPVRFRDVHEQDDRQTGRGHRDVRDASPPMVPHQQVAQRPTPRT